MKITLNTTSFDKRRELVRQWPERTRAIQRQFIYEVATRVHDDLLERIPADMRTLRRSLQIARIVGLPDNTYGYAVRAVVRGRAVKKADANTSVLYVSEKRGVMQSMPDWLRILKSYNPWTADTLPIRPDPKFARVLSRRVSERVVSHVRFLRRSDRRSWRRELIAAGVRLPSPTDEVRTGRMAQAIPDVAYDSLRLEFGLGGVSTKPHWRPAVLDLATRGGAGKIARQREYVRTMKDIGFGGWEAWRQPVVARIPIARAKKYVPFQERLGIRVRR